MQASSTVEQHWYTFRELEERVPDFRSCSAETASAKFCADKGSREKFDVGESEETGKTRNVVVRPA